MQWGASHLKIKLFNLMSNKFNNLRNVYRFNTNIRMLENNFSYAYNFHCVTMNSIQQYFSSNTFQQLIMTTI